MMLTANNHSYDTRYKGMLRTLEVIDNKGLDRLGIVKSEDEKGFIENGNGKDIPAKIQQPGYSEAWKRMVAEDNGEILKVVK